MPPHKRLFGLRERAAKASGRTNRPQSSEIAEGMDCHIGITT